MKELIAGIAMAVIASTANAMPTLTRPVSVQPSHDYNYNAAYNAGKDDAYQNVATTLFVLGAAVVVGIVVYELGQESGSRWGLSENGVVWRF